METKYDPADSPGPLLHPLTGWETASRWNAVAVEWMTRGVQQWVALVTASLPGPTRAAPVRTRANEHAAASSGKPKRNNRPKRAARAKG